MLCEKTLFGWQNKIETAIDRIQAFEPLEGYVVAFSGGKDSIVTLDLVRRASVKHSVIFNKTTVDPPELIKFIRQYYPEVPVSKPKKTMWELIEENKFPPTRRIRYCCAELKENSSETMNAFVLTGVRAAESVKRAKRKFVENCYKNNRRRFMHPIFDWSDSEVWEYIKINRLPYCDLYNQGWRRIGCILCPNSTIRQKERDILRYPGFVKLYKRSFERILQKKSFRNWKSGDDIFNWWISDLPGQQKEEGQMMIFD